MSQEASASTAKPPPRGSVGYASRAKPPPPELERTARLDAVLKKRKKRKEEEDALTTARWKEEVRIPTLRE